jgi:hypothetical protein
MMEPNVAQREGTSARCVDTVRAMSGVFVAATTVRRSVTEARPVTADGAQVVRFAGEVAPGWDIGGNANGGYLMAIAGRRWPRPSAGRP